jgi:hypothetical protein
MVFASAWVTLLFIKAVELFMISPTLFIGPVTRLHGEEPIEIQSDNISEVQWDSLILWISIAHLLDAGQQPHDSFDRDLAKPASRKVPHIGLDDRRSCARRRSG